MSSLIVKLIGLILVPLLLLSACDSASRTWNWVRLKLHLVDQEGILSLKEVHLDGDGLLNQEVDIVGIVESQGEFNTFVVIVENDVRMLVDLSKVQAVETLDQVRIGSRLAVTGTVHSGTKGHVYVVARSVIGG